MRPLLPRVGDRSPSRTEKPRKNRRTAVACNVCRERKTACDGTRPKCAACTARNSECRYAAKESETQLQAIKREHKDLTDLINHLRTVPEDTAQAILHELRTSSNPLSVLQRFENGQILVQPSAQSAALSALPPIHSEAEFKLMVQHPAAYPALNLSLDAILSKNTLLESAKILAFDLPCSQGACVQYNPDNKSDPQPPNEVFEASASKYLDPLLAFLQIDHWTSVSVTPQFAASAISLYLETDHQTLRMFDVQLFLNDLIHFRHDHCSAFLVNSLLAFASQPYTIKDATAAAKSFEFEKEAQMLWRAERADTLPNLAGLMFLFMSIGSHGQGGNEAVLYSFEAAEMAKRMKLFGNQDTLTAEQISSLTEEAQRALQQTTWGVFNMHNIRTQLYFTPPLDYPPSIPVPEHSNSIRFRNGICRFVRMQASNSIYDEVFMYICRLHTIVSEAFIVVRDPDLTRPPPLAFIMSKYAKMLDLMGNLPVRVRRSGKAPVVVLQLHMYFHEFVMDLFRVFVTSRTVQTTHYPYRDFGTPKAIFAASEKQLKGLIIEIITYHTTVSRGVVWHPALLYTANAVIKDTASPDWRFYFFLCIHCYSELLDAWVFAKGAIQSLFALAIDHHAISKQEATNILNSVLNKTQFKDSSERQVSAYMTDLDLAMRDREAAATAALAKRFEEITIFDEFTEGGSQEENL